MKLVQMSHNADRRTDRPSWAQASFLQPGARTAVFDAGGY